MLFDVGRSRNERSFRQDAGGYVQAAAAPCSARPRGWSGVPRRIVRSSGRGVRRDMLQHVARGVFRGHYRPIVCRPNRHDDLPANRQLRRRPRRFASRSSGIARASRAGHVLDAIELAKQDVAARIPEGRRGRRDRRRRHAGPCAACARARRHAGGDINRGCRRFKLACESARERTPCRSKPR